METYEKMNKKYRYNQDELTFSKEQVIEKLKNKFQAKEFSKEKLLDLVNDDQLEYSKIFSCLCINDSAVLLKLFSDKERKLHKEEIMDNRENPLNPKKVKKKEWEYNHILLDEQEGRRLDIILESQDDKYISGFIVRGNSEKLNRYLNALVEGALIQLKVTPYPADIGDEYFQFYLENIEMFGFLK
ncbi:hypothetical protein [Saliterribacillus persicus]|uniref:Uncharacterized protein n=1 Tax=Saliterribacillus persicus TaxID=930114 RepID=A0A368Y3N3_9BACI|nr:hypothetical protein [Saliterribacillus persicus]RCW74910.1 hypothetical protein DFR57_103207 [Saliterribacillus persicus]